MSTRNEIKGYMAMTGWKMVDLVEEMKNYGIETTTQALSNKLTRNTIRYSEVKIITEIIGYDLTWNKKD